MKKKTVRDVDVAGKCVLVRVDFNVPLKDGVITDDTRIRASLPTIRYLLDKGAKLILASHLGRPRGREERYSLAPVARRLSELLGCPVVMAPDCIGPEVKRMIDDLRPGQVLLLENVRFYQEEEKNDPGFARELASLAEVFVNDAFGAAHRAHASTAGVAEHIPAVAGLLMEKEVRALSAALAGARRPVVAVLGGAKVSDKIGVIRNLLPRVDRILIGGGMANTFFKARGLEMGRSLVEEDKLSDARSILEEAGEKLVLPEDLIITREIKPGAEHREVGVGEVPPDWLAVDIGGKTVDKFGSILAGAGTIIWNGPMGVFEVEPFDRGTGEIARAVADSGALSVVGGGDSVAALEKFGLADRISHVSTGGGASLEFLEGRRLPGVEALENLRRPVVAGNWKMYKTLGEAREFVSRFLPLVAEIWDVEIVLCPPFTALETVATLCRGTNVYVGAQDMHWENEGAYTGEVSARMIAEAGAKYVIVGHSERRQYFGETDENVSRKVRAALAAGLTPLICIGETLAEREAGVTKDVVKRQLGAAVEGLTAGDVEKTIVTYEPVWAIGTGKTASPQDAEEMISYIRQLLEERFGSVARTVRIQYGGSVRPDNIADLMDQPNIDGVLVGGASLDPASFAAIVRY